MEKRQFKRSLAAVLCLVLIVASVCCILTGCGEKKNEKPADRPAGMPEMAKTVGDGKTTFVFSVVDLDGNKKDYLVKTDETTVGEALFKAGLAEGEEGAYGLEIKVVDGIRMDYTLDKAYWAFYIDGDYAMTGVSETEIDPDAAYMLKAEKA